MSITVHPCWGVTKCSVEGKYDLFLRLQSHLSTRRYGTVTHQPPELLVAGKLTPAADIYSFGVMSESQCAETTTAVENHQQQQQSQHP